MLADTTKFKTLDVKRNKEIMYMINIQNNLKNVFTDLRKDDKISQNVFSTLNPVGSQPGLLYGLSKVHKPLDRGLPKMRPILSAIGTAPYNLAKFIMSLNKILL